MLSALVSLLYFKIACFLKAIPRVERSRRFSLVVVKLDGIGDMVISSPVLGALLGQAVGADPGVALVCSKECQALATRLYPGVHVIAVDSRRMRKSFFYRVGAYFDMTRLMANQVVHLTFSRSFNDAELVTFCLEAPIKTAPKDDLANKGVFQSWLSSFFYSELLAVPNGVDEYDRYRHLGLLLKCRDFGNPLAEAIEKQESQFLREKYFVVFPGASFGLKRWPIELFLRLASDIQSQTGLTPCWVGGPSDLTQIPELQGTLPGVSFVGKTQLFESIKIISQACFVVTNDSSAAHFAKTLSVPFIVLAGGGHFGRFISEVPTSRQISFYHKIPCFGCSWRCHLVDSRDQSAPCLSQIPYAPVLKACLDMGAMFGGS